MRLWHLLLAGALIASAACHPGPVLGSGGQPSVGGTIAGIVTTSDPLVALPGRKVTAIDVANGRRYDAITATNGGYTIKVPEGTYRLEVDLRSGETFAKQPDQTHINNGDLDPHRDFMISVR